jgi:multidrug efflux system membrane fusion protein
MPIPRTYWFVILPILILSLSIIAFKTLNQTHILVANTPLVETFQIQPATFKKRIKIPSFLLAKSDVAIRPRGDGMIKKIFFKEGQTIKKNDLLIQLDDDLLRAQLRQAEANLSKNQALLDEATKEHTRNLELIEKKVISKAALDVSESNKKTAEASIASDMAIIDALKLQIEYMQIKSPMDGLIGFVKVEEGTFVRQAENAPIVYIADISPIEAIFDIPEEHAKHLIGRSIDQIHVDLFDNKGNPFDVKAIVIAFDRELSPKSGTLQIKVEADNPYFKLRPGMSVVGYVGIKKIDNAIVLPLQAVLMGQDGNYVFVYDPKDHTLHKRIITLNDTNEHEAYVKSGVEVGEYVVTDGQISLSDGMKVKGPKA